MQLAVALSIRRFCYIQLAGVDVEQLPKAIVFCYNTNTNLNICTILSLYAIKNITTYSVVSIQKYVVLVHLHVCGVYTMLLRNGNQVATKLQHWHTLIILIKTRYFKS